MPLFVMPENPLQNKKAPTIADLFPQLSREKQNEAEFYLHRYLEAVRRIFERIKRENPEILTEIENRVRLRKKEKKGLNLNRKSE